MYKLILLLTFSFISRLGFAQIYFTMDSIWAPRYICQASAFDVEVFGMVSGGNIQAGSQRFLVSNDTIYAQFHFVSGVGPAIPYPLYRKINIPATFNFGTYKIVAQGIYNGQVHKTLTSAISICSGFLATSKEIIPEPTLSIHPNPAQDLVKIKLPFPARNAFLKLTDATGKTVQTAEINNGVSETRLNLQNLPAGLYLLQVSTSEGIFTQKLIRN